MGTNLMQYCYTAKISMDLICDYYLTTGSEIHMIDTWSDTDQQYTVEVHREDGPAITWSDGDTRWFHHGKIHRVDGPALTHDQGYEWYFDGNLHRSDGPAIIGFNGYKAWYQNGIRHRDDGPAIEFKTQVEYWKYGEFQYKEAKVSTCKS